MTLLVLTHGHKHIKLMTKHPSDVSTSLHASVLPSETAGTRKWDIIWLSNETNLIWFTQTMVQKRCNTTKYYKQGMLYLYLTCSHSPQSSCLASINFFSVRAWRRASARVSGVALAETKALLVDKWKEVSTTFDERCEIQYDTVKHFVAK